MLLFVEMPAANHLVLIFTLPAARKVSNMQGLRTTSLFGNFGKRSFSTGGGDKPPWKNFSIPNSHYISKASVSPWLLRMLELGKQKNSYKVWGRHVYLHCLNQGGEPSIMMNGLKATEGRFTGALVRAHTVTESEMRNADRALPGTSEYFFITHQKPRQDHDGTMTGVEWDVQYLEVIAWLMRFSEGDFYIGGDLLKELGEDGKSPKK